MEQLVLVCEQCGQQYDLTGYSADTEFPCTCGKQLYHPKHPSRILQSAPLRPMPTGDFPQMPQAGTMPGMVPFPALVPMQPLPSPGSGMGGLPPLHGGMGAPMVGQPAPAFPSSMPASVPGAISIQGSVPSEPQATTQQPGFTMDSIGQGTQTGGEPPSVSGGSAPARPYVVPDGGASSPSLSSIPKPPEDMGRKSRTPVSVEETSLESDEPTQTPYMSGVSGPSSSSGSLSSLQARPELSSSGSGSSVPAAEKPKGTEPRKLEPPPRSEPDIPAAVPVAAPASPPPEAEEDRMPQATQVLRVDQLNSMVDWNTIFKQKDAKMEQLASEVKQLKTDWKVQEKDFRETIVLLKEQWSQIQEEKARADAEAEEAASLRKEVKRLRGLVGALSSRVEAMERLLHSSASASQLPAVAPESVPEERPPMVTAKEPDAPVEPVAAKAEASEPPKESSPPEDANVEETTTEPAESSESADPSIAPVESVDSALANEVNDADGVSDADNAGGEDEVAELASDNPTEASLETTPKEAEQPVEPKQPEERVSVASVTTTEVGFEDVPETESPVEAATTTEVVSSEEPEEPEDEPTDEPGSSATVDIEPEATFSVEAEGNESSEDIVAKGKVEAVQAEEAPVEVEAGEPSEQVVEETASAVESDEQVSAEAADSVDSPDSVDSVDVPEDTSATDTGPDVSEALEAASGPSRPESVPDTARFRRSKGSEEFLWVEGLKVEDDSGQMVREGNWRFWSEDGLLLREVPYKRGRKDGEVRIYDPESGELIQQSTFAEGERRGPFWRRVEPDELTETEVVSLRGFCEGDVMVGRVSWMNSSLSTVFSTNRGGETSLDAVMRVAAVDSQEELVRLQQAMFNDEQLAASCLAAIRLVSNGADSTILGDVLDHIAPPVTEKRAQAVAQVNLQLASRARQMDKPLVGIKILLESLFDGAELPTILREMAALFDDCLDSRVAYDCITLAVRMAPERQEFSFTHALIAMGVGELEQAQAAISLLDEFRPEQALFLDCYFRSLFPDFDFWPTADARAYLVEAFPSLSGVVWKRSLGEVQWLIQATATRIESIRADLLTRFIEEPEWIAPSVAHLLPDGPIALSDEEAIEPGMGLVDLCHSMRVEWSRLTWLCWLTGSEDIETPEALSGKRDIGAFLALQQKWLAFAMAVYEKESITTRTPEEEQLLQVPWFGIPLAELPYAHADFVSRDCVELLVSFEWLTHLRDTSPFVVED